MKKKLGIWILILVAVVGGGVYYYNDSKAAKPQFQSAQISKGNLTLKIMATGTVQPQNRLQIKSPLAGRVDEVLVREGDKVKRGQIMAWLSSTERAALIDAARAQGHAEVRRWEDLYKRTPLVAPISGTIILRSVEPGQTFTTADAVLVMSDRLTIKAVVDETDLAQIKLQQKAEITLDAYPNKILPAVVDQIAFEAKNTNNVTTYIINVLPDEDIDYMRSGMTANITFLGQNKENIVLIPNEYIKYENGKAFTLVQAGEKQEIKTSLELGLSDGKVTEVVSGLNENDTVLLQIVKKDDKSSAGSLFAPGRPGGRKGGK